MSTPTERTDVLKMMLMIQKLKFRKNHADVTATALL